MNDNKNTQETLDNSNKELHISDVIQRNEQLVCPNCKSLHIMIKPFNYVCHHCGQKFRQTNCV